MPRQKRRVPSAAQSHSSVFEIGHDAKKISYRRSSSGEMKKPGELPPGL
jgi:hypothetical protein